MARWLRWLERCPVTAEVRGSSPLRVGRAGTVPPLQFYGWVPEWPKGTDCKSAGNAFGGSNPPPSMLLWGVSSAGRASALQAGGHRFEPYTPHFYLISRGRAAW